jgi:hypothetical protein
MTPIVHAGFEERIELGIITVPSGILVMTDMGYLGSWSGSASPSRVPDQITDPELRASIAAAQDYRLVGRDAEAAARVVDLQSLTYVYDIPRHGVPAIMARYEEAIKEHGFDARLEREPSRVPHRERARRAAAAGGADFIIDGVWSVAVGGIPTARPLPVVGHRRDYGEGVGPRWSEVKIEIEQDQISNNRARLGLMGVDWARIIAIDLEALGSWVHERSLDGLADVAYWGRDASAAHAAFGGNELEDRTTGWSNLPEAEALELAVRIEQWQRAPNHKLVVDYRPHSHHYQVTQQIGPGGEFGVGWIEVGGASVVAFHTSWGDGVYPVYRTGTSDRPSGLQIELGDEARRQRMHKLTRPGEP